MTTGSVAVMQGTVATFDATDHTGTLLLDDGTELAFPAEAFHRSGLRLLRLGQRLVIGTNASGEVEQLNLPGIAPG